MLKKIASLLLIVTAIVAVVQVVFWLGRLPVEVPMHFNAAGDPDRWSGRTEFIGLFAALQLLVLVLLPLIGMMTGLIPKSLINIPNKDYWLADGRRAETLATITGLLALIGALSSWLFIGLFQLTSLVAVGDRNTIAPEIYWLTGAYVIILFVICAAIAFRFRRKSESKIAPHSAVV